MTRTSDNPNSAISRRLFNILGISTAGTAALTACQADTGDGETGTGEVGSTNPERVLNVGQPFLAPPTGHFNMAPGVAQQLLLGVYGGLIMPSGGMWNWEAEEWLYLMADGIEVADDSLVYSLAPDLTWSDGSSVTAEDVELTFWISWLMNQPAWNAGVVDVEATGDQEVLLSLTEPTALVERYVMKTNILPSALYGEFGERARDAFEAGEDSDSDNANTLRQELMEWRPDNNDILVSGPFVWDFDRISDASLTLVKNENGVLSDQVTFDQIVIYDGETEDITPLVLDGTIDYATHAFPIATQEEWEAQGVETRYPGIYTGGGVWLSLGRHAEFNDVRVRRAFAHLFDRREATTAVYGDDGVTPEHLTGLPNLLNEQWLNEETLAELDPYDYDQDRAAVLLEEAGWTRDNGSWFKPSGDVAAYEFMFQGDQVNTPVLAQYLSEIFGEFGISLELDGIESGNYNQRLLLGQFDLASGIWGAGEPHPQASFRRSFFDFNFPVAQNQGGRGIDYELVREVEGFGEVDIEELVRESAEGFDEERHRALINQLALIQNRDLPILQVWERVGNSPARSGPRVQEFPPMDSPIWANGAYADNPVIMGMYSGEINPS